MTNDLPESEYDKVEDFYINWLDKNLPDRDERINPSTEIMLNMLGDVQGVRACDLACGEGYLARVLASRGALVTGIDISRILLRNAQEHSNQAGITYVLDDAQSMKQVSDASMDAVICNMALMDILDLSATFSSIRRVLVDGGKFIFRILHPCFVSPFNVEDPPEEFDEDGNFQALRVSRYSQEGKWYSGGTGMCGTLGSHHRMLSTYLNTLSASRFQLVEISEPLFPPKVANVKNRDSVVPTFFIEKSNCNDVRVALPSSRYESRERSSRWFTE